MQAFHHWPVSYQSIFFINQVIPIFQHRPIKAFCHALNCLVIVAIASPNKMRIACSFADLLRRFLPGHRNMENHSLSLKLPSDIITNDTLTRNSFSMLMMSTLR